LKEDDEASPEALFVMKSDALNFLAALAPPGQSRDKALEEYREFLEEYYPSIENVNLWFTMFRHMLLYRPLFRRSQEQSLDIGWTGENSNPIIALYSKIETSVGPPGRDSSALAPASPKGEGAPGSGPASEGSNLDSNRITIHPASRGYKTDLRRIGSLPATNATKKAESRTQ